MAEGATGFRISYKEFRGTEKPKIVHQVVGSALIPIYRKVGSQFGVTEILQKEGETYRNQYEDKKTGKSEEYVGSVPEGNHIYL